MTPPPISAAVFASGSGTNFKSLLDAQDRGASWCIRLLVSDREDAGALERARKAGVTTRVVAMKGRDGAEVEAEILAALDEEGVGVIFLAGYLRLVPAGVIARFRHRILNIHPALLPSFGGKGMYGRHVHQAVIASGARVSGPTVHFVDERYDEGSVVAQWPVPVLPDDTAEGLAARILEVEHRLYPLAAEHVCRALMGGGKPGPLPLDGDAFSIMARLADTTLDARFRNTFSPPPEGS